MDEDRRRRWGLFLVVFVSYAWFFGGSGFNQNASFDQARAIVERRTLQINAYAANTYDISVVDGRIYPNKAPGTAFLAAVAYAPLYALESAAAADSSSFPLLTLNLYLVTLIVCGISGAIVAMLVERCARRNGADPRWAIMLAFLVAFGTPLFAYSTMLFSHVPSVMSLFLSYDLVARPNRRPYLGGLAAGAAGVLNYLCIPAAAILTLYIAVRERRDALRFIAGAAPMAILLAIYQKICFGGFATLPIEQMNPGFVDEKAFLGIIRPPTLEALWGVTGSPYRGLFLLSPFLIVGLAALGAKRFRIFDSRIEAFLVVALLAFFLWFNASFNGWHGGYAIGPRYLLPLIPFLVLPLMGVERRWRSITLALGVIAVAFNLVATAVDPQPPDSVKNPLFDYAVPALVLGHVPQNSPVPQWLRELYTGHVAINRVATDEPLPFQKHPPGSPPSEWASFNLGEIFIAQGHWTSLLPIIVWMVTGWWWLARQSSSSA